MKRLLPIIVSFLIGIFSFSVIFPSPVIAQLEQEQLENPDGNWIIDDEVTAIGKNAARSGLLLDWALQDYNWAFTSPGTQNPLLPFWVTLRNIVYALLIAVVMIAAIVMLVTRGRSLTIQRFIPRFIIIVVLVTLSFSIVQVLYELVDVIQGFFIRPGGVPVSQKDLLFIGWDYEQFLGLRLLGDDNFESAFTTLLFVKLTTFTYYVMLGILLVRKIILWFFIIISPLFPLLLFFYPLRNTAKIWLGEFFRWLLYAPLFAIFLAGVISLWRLGIPLSFNFGSVNNASSIIFPTAVSILLGGPGQAVGQLNNLNIVDTYAQYIVALMMLWGVIIVPWILLQIFLDYLSDVNISSNPALKQIAGVINKLPLNPPPGTPPPSPDSSGTGRARSIPLIKDFRIPSIANLAKPIPRETNVNVQTMTKLSVPTLRDIARFESQSVSNSEKTRQEAQRIRETLTNIAHPAQIQTEKDRSEFERIRETLQNQSLKGDKIAANILQASENYASNVSSKHDEKTTISTIINQLQNPNTVTNQTEREKIVTLKERIEKESRDGNPLASRLSQSLSPAVNQTNLTQALEKLVTPSRDAEMFEKTEHFKEKLKEESSQGNSLATTILSTVTSLTEHEKVTNSLIKIIQPASISNSTERERFERISQSLQKETNEGNDFASNLTEKLESLKQTTDTSEKEKIVSEIRESVIKENQTGNPLASLILGQIEHLQDATSESHVIRLSEELAKAQKEGNPLAQELMALSQKENLSEAEVKDIESKVSEAKKNGDPLGVLLSELLERRQKALEETELPKTLPKVNRIQHVSLDDYEAVKKMWTENYENLEVPGAEGSNRKAWIQDDIKQITETIDLLSSESAENVQKGMEKVSDILPFLLIGGFSQSEITAYLKAKMEAAKGVLTQLEKIDTSETEVLLEKKKTEAPKHMTQTVSVEEPVSESAQTQSINSRISSPHFTGDSNPVQIVHPVSSPLVANEAIVRMANLTIPTLKNIAQYEKMQLVGQEKQNQDITLMRETLRGIADPKSAENSTKKQYYSDIRSHLLSEQKEGNALANSLLTSAQIVSTKKISEEISSYAKLVSLLKSLSSDEKVDEKYSQLLKRISFESANGNEFARKIEPAISDPKILTDKLQVLNLTGEILKAKSDGDPLAVDMLSLAESQAPNVYQPTVQSLVSSQVLLQKFIDPTYLPDAQKQQIMSLKDAIEKHQSEPFFQKFSEILVDISQNGIDLPSIVKTEELLRTYRKDIQSSLPLLLTLGEKDSTKPQTIGEVLKHIADPKLTSPDVSEARETIKKNQADPFVTRLLTWSQDLSSEQISNLSDVFRGIADPDSMSENKRFEYLRLRDSLEKEAKTDAFARFVLDISKRILSGKLSLGDVKTLLPNVIEKAFRLSLTGNISAISLQNLFYEELSNMQNVTIFHHILMSLSDPSRLQVDQKQAMLSLRSLVQTEGASGNSLANSIKTMVNSVLKKEVTPHDDVLTALWNEIVKQQKKGNTLAQAFVTEVQKQKDVQYLFDLGEVLKSLGHPESVYGPESQSFQALRKTLDEKAESGDHAAMSILSAIEIIRNKGVDLSEVRKVGEILKNSESTSYIQGLQVLISTSLFSMSTLHMIKEILMGLHTDQRLVPLKNAIDSLHDTELWELINASSTDMSESTNSQKEEETLAHLRDSLLLEEARGNSTAKLFLQTVCDWKENKKIEVFENLLQKMANPQTIQLPEEKDSIEKLRGELEKHESDDFAQVIEAVLSTFSGNQTTNIEKLMPVIQDHIVGEAKKGNPLAKELVTTYRLEPTSEDEMVRDVENEAKKGNPVATFLVSLIRKRKHEAPEIVLPKTNDLQQVSIEDYEAVKRMWLEGYKSLDVPGVNRTREEWLSEEVDTISQTISLLTSQNPLDQEEGTQRVSHILPFLLIGGFSNVEVVSYLKSKLEAAQEVLRQLHDKSDDEETKLPSDQIGKPSKITPLQVSRDR